MKDIPFSEHDDKREEEHNTTTPAQTSSETRQFSGRTIAFTLAGTMLVTFIATLDQTVVGTALPRIVADLQGFELITWITTVYLLTSTVTIPIYGKLSDLFGRKTIFLAAVAIFLIGSALCGIAQNMTQLVIYRAFQGIGAGGLQPIASAVVADLFPPRERGRWIGITSSSYALATIIGPLAGGVLTDVVSWRWVFYVNLPIGLVALLVLAFLMPTLRQPNKQVRIDYIGALLVVLAVLPLLLGFDGAGSRFEWLSWQSLGWFGSSLLLLVLLVIYSMRQEQQGGEPIIEPSMFKDVRIFSVSLAASALIYGALIGCVYFIPVFLQSVVGISATSSGATTIPFALCSIAGAVIGGQIISMTGRYKLQALIGTAFIITGLLLLLRLNLHSNVFDIIIPLTVMGAGVGCNLSLFAVTVQNAMPYRLGQATAALIFFRQIGQSIGLAAFGSVVISSYVPSFTSALPAQLKAAIPAQLLKAFENPLILLSQDAMQKIQAGFDRFGAQGHTAFLAVLDAVKVGITESIHQSFILGLVILVVTLLITFALKEIPLRKRQHEEQQEA